MQEARSVTISSSMTIKRPSDTSETDRKPKLSMGCRPVYTDCINRNGQFSKQAEIA